MTPFQKVIVKYDLQIYHDQVSSVYIYMYIFTYVDLKNKAQIELKVARSKLQAFLS